MIPDLLAVERLRTEWAELPAGLEAFPQDGLARLEAAQQRRRTALSRLTPAPEAVVVALVDQPGIGPVAVARLLSGGVGRSRLAAAGYGGRRGHPVLFGAAHWAGIIASAAGDHGARGYLTEHQDDLTLVECGDIASPADIDTPADLRLLDEAGNRPVPPTTNR